MDNFKEIMEIMEIGEIITAIMSLVAFTLSLIVFLKIKNHNARDHMYRFKNWQMEINKLMIEKPKIYKFINSNEPVPDDFFDVNAEDSDFNFSTQGLVLLHLSFFDVIIDVLERDKAVRNTVDDNKWREYIMNTIRRPVYLAVYKKNGNYYGNKLYEFVREIGIEPNSYIHFKKKSFFEFGFEKRSILPIPVNYPKNSLADLENIKSSYNKYYQRHQL